MKILVVEDEQNVSSFIKRGLDEHEHQVTQAIDTLTILRVAKDDEFDINMLDVIMPGMDCIE